MMKLVMTIVAVWAMLIFMIMKTSIVITMLMVLTSLTSELQKYIYVKQHVIA